MITIGLGIQGIEQITNLAAAVLAYPNSAATAGREAANDVARTVITDASRDISQRYNLPASYIRDKFRLQLATTNDIAIVAAQRRTINLSRFEANQLTAPAPRAKGDARRKIGKGRKQAGVSVKVLRAGARKAMPGAFLVPLLAGSESGGNGMGLFVRIGPGRNNIKRLAGPAPYQVFSAWVKEHRPDIKTQLANAWQSRIQREIRRSGK